MSKINNNLILVFAILAFVFGLSLATPASAYYSFTSSEGVVFHGNPPIDYSTPIYYQASAPVVYKAPVVNNGPVVIPGCEGRNTGYSTVSGQSCVGNYIAPTTTTTTTTKTTAVKNVNNTVAKTTTPAPVKVATASDVNDSYGSLTANALFGSNSFMPTGLVQWIIFAIIVLLIIFLWRYIHRSEEKYLSSPLKHA
jgi:hypothetical protein